MKIQDIQQPLHRKNSKKCSFAVLVITILAFMIIYMSSSAARASDVLYELYSDIHYSESGNQWIAEIAEYNGEIYIVAVGRWNGWGGGNIYRLEDEACKIWKDVTPQWTSNPNSTPVAMTVFNEYLYMGTDQAEIYRFDGNSWLDVTGDYGGGWVQELVEFNEALYVNGSWRLKDDTVIPHEWEQVWDLSATQCLNPARAGIESVEIFDGYLYAGVGCDAPNGIEIWRTSNGTDWTMFKKVGELSNIGHVHDMQPFNGNLYINQYHGCTDDLAIQDLGLFRTNGTNWELVHTGITCKAGDPYRLVVRQINPSTSYLYLGLANMISTPDPGHPLLYRSADGDTWEASEGPLTSTENYSITSLMSSGYSIYMATRSPSPGTIAVSGLGPAPAPKCVRPWEMGFCYEGEDLDFFPNDIAKIGDINADDVPDILAGTDMQIGRYVILSGMDGSVLRNVLSSGSEFQGSSVAAYGNYDSDGVPDYLVGAPFASPDGKSGAGEIRLFSGADGAILQRFKGQAADEYIGFNHSVATVGDVDDDGTSDVAVGAPSADGNGLADAGKLYMFSGKTGAVLWTSTEGSIYEDDNYGMYVDVVGDVNADGKPDIITGTPAADDRFAGGWGAAGEVRIISGKDGSTIHMFTVSNNGRVGSSVTGLGGDINGDGVPDAAFGADCFDCSSGAYSMGQVVIVSGSDGGVIRIIDETQLNNTSGVSGYSFGTRLALDETGDVDGDGIPDLVNGAPNFGWGGFGQGALAVYSSDGGSLKAVLDSDISISPIQNEQMGGVVAGVGDLNGDGVADVAGGARFYSPLNGDYNGRLCVFYIKPEPVANAGPDQTVIVNESVMFDGSGSKDMNGTIVSYEWDFGDSNTDTGVETSHVYTATGLYSVTLTVTDDDGLTGSDSALITVKTPAETTQDLSTKVDGMGLPLDIEQGLMDKLTAAQNLIEKKKYKPAKNLLSAFMNQVNSQIGKTLTSEQADELIAIAQRIIDSI